MRSAGGRLRSALLWTATLAVPVISIGLALVLLRPVVVRRLEPLLFNYVAASLSREERERIQQQIAESQSGLWDAVPEPDVARLAQRDVTRKELQAEVRTNNAGLRSSQPYHEKAADVFRILCLGDSMVFGAGGPEEDRFCDQLEVFYREAGVAPEGRRIETYALGLGSWTLVQEASYLSSRISAYDPDVIILVAVVNDITDAFGVTGTGAATRGFSPEWRSLGSAVFSNKIGLEWGDPSCCSALTWDLSPESRVRWDKAIQRLARLVELQQQRGRQILLSVLDPAIDSGRYSHFSHLLRQHVDRAGIRAPLVSVSFLIREEGTTLPHDPGHPNRLGHRHLRDQYVHALHGLGWIRLPEARLPALDPKLRAPEAIPLDADALHAERVRYIRRYIPEEIDFSRLEGRTHALLGGVFPEDDKHLRMPPWASLRAGFLLRRPEHRSVREVEVEIEVPPLAELFPFSVELHVDGMVAGRFSFAAPDGGDVHRLTAPVAPASAEDSVVEVILETGSFFSGITDARMKSYKLLGARLR
jgi:hypothetical protein